MKKYPRKASNTLVRKVPMMMQMEALECGAVCLNMIYAYYGLLRPLEETRKDCGVSRNGSNAKNILKAARNQHFNAKGYRYEIDTLKKKGKFPCIIHWNLNHFVVLKGFKKNKVYINDPSRGEIIVSEEEFEQSFTGICLILEPDELFIPKGKTSTVFDTIKEILSKSKKAFVIVLISAIFTSLFALIYPVFSRVFLDRLLTYNNPNWIYPFFILLFTICLARFISQCIEINSLLKIDGKFSVVNNAKYMWHILRLPLDFYAQRSSGDILNRQKMNEMIAGTMIKMLAPAILDICLMLFYLVVMTRYSWILTTIAACSVVSNLTIEHFITKKITNLNRVKLNEEAKLSNVVINGIDMIEMIKASGAENGYFQKWAGYQALVHNKETSIEKIQVYIGMIPLIISSICDVLLLGTGIYLTMNNEFSMGMILAFQGFVSSLNLPIKHLIQAHKGVLDLNVNMERVKDVFQYPCDIEYGINNISDEVEYDKLSGDVQLKNVTFGYSSLEEPLINNLNIHVHAGESIAIVGKSGCGKSTISKLITGLYSVWSGEILFDGVPMNEINREVFTSSVAVVDQEIILFEDTIANNIKMWDDSIEDFEMILAARDAHIHDTIIERDNGYQYKMLEGGKDFSGGQRQRIEIARVLAQDPTIVIMDEATSALDAVTEHEVIQSIKARGITVIVIAHRLSTIRDCDQIIVLDKGKIVEQGTHESLISNDGIYKELIISE